MREHRASETAVDAVLQGAPQVLFANETLAQPVRQVVLYGGDGLPVLSTDGNI